MINHKNIILKVLTHKKCKKVLANNFVTYKVDSLTIKVKNQVSKKIDSFIKAKKFQMLEKFIHMYSDMMFTNFEESR